MAQMQVLIDTLVGMRDIRKITFIRNWYGMPGGIMPLGYNFWEFVAISLYITSDIVIISALCLKNELFLHHLWTHIFSLSSVLKIRPHITQNTTWILYKPVGTLKTIGSIWECVVFWSYLGLSWSLCPS